MLRLILAEYCLSPRHVYPEKGLGKTRLPQAEEQSPTEPFRQEGVKCRGILVEGGGGDQHCSKDAQSPAPAHPAYLESQEDAGHGECAGSTAESKLLPSSSQTA